MRPEWNHNTGTMKGMQRAVNIVVSERIKIPTAPLPPMFKKKLTERLVFTNPEYEFRQSRGGGLVTFPLRYTASTNKDSITLFHADFSPNCWFSASNSA